MIKKIVTGIALGCAGLFIYSLIQLYLTYGLFDLWKQLFLSVMGGSASAVFLLSFYTNKTKEWLIYCSILLMLICSVMNTSLLEYLWAFQAGLLFLLMGFSTSKIEVDATKLYLKTLKQGTSVVLIIFGVLFLVSKFFEFSLLPFVIIQLIGFAGVLLFVYLNLINKAFR